MQTVATNWKLHVYGYGCAGNCGLFWCRVYLAAQLTSPDEPHQKFMIAKESVAEMALTFFGIL